MKTVELYKQFCELYGAKYPKDKLAVMMQVGDFYEFYGVENENLCFGNVTQIASLLDIVRGRKNKECEFVSIDSPLFTGFPKHSAQKHVKKLLDNDYYIVQIDQNEVGGKIERTVTKVISKGSYIDDLTSTESKTVACIYHDCDGGVGVSFLDLSIGVCKAYEIRDESSEITRLIEAENPCQIIRVSVDGSIGDAVNVQHTKVKYQEVILQYFFPERGFLSAIEYIDLELKHNARISLVCLLQEMKNQDQEIVKKLSKPVSYDDHVNLKLEDTALYQLGIVSNGSKQEGTLFHTINKTCTQQGKRLLKKSILSPMVNEEKINESYEYVEQFIGCDITSELRSLVDVEKYVHKWRLGKISPHEFVIMAYCFPTIKDIVKKVHSNTNMKFDKFDDFLKCGDEMKNIFYYELLEKYTSLSNIESNIFKRGVKPQLDILQDKIDGIFHRIDTMLNDLQKKDKTEKKQAAIKFERTNDAWYFATTSKRVDSLKKVNALEKWSVRNQKSNVRLFHDEIDECKAVYMETLKDMIELVKTEFVFTLESLEQKYNETMKQLVVFIGLSDFYNCGAVLVNTYGYKKPNIVKSDESFIECKGVRHAVIERLDHDVGYVPNDVMLPENEKSGMLLFGLNGGGKSSYMKSVGLCVVLAQIGYWVPCDEMNYMPFTRLFTRISGDDNVIKGLSSFAVEMKELRGILQKSDTRSLVLGDEICKGTEQDSALGIVAASLVTLSKRNKSRFIFATHLHALSKMEQIQELVNIYHLSVDCENDKIVYHRKLLPGSGPSLYGLKVARYLLHDPEVIKLAEELRPSENQSMKESKYNANVVVKECEICKTCVDLDVHHIQFQCEANDFNLVDNGMHKNAKSNLVVLCKEHHQQVHQDKIIIHGWKETSGGRELVWENKVPKPKVKKCKYDEGQMGIILKYKSSGLPRKTIAMKLKDDYGIHISVGTLGKYYSEIKS